MAARQGRLAQRTWVGVRETTKLREMLRQSPLPNFCRPSRNSRCSSSVQGMPFLRSCSEDLLFCSTQRGHHYHLPSQCRTTRLFFLQQGLSESNLPHACHGCKFRKEEVEVYDTSSWIRAKQVGGYSPLRWDRQALLSSGTWVALSCRPLYS